MPSNLRALKRAIEQPERVVQVEAGEGKLCGPAQPAKRGGAEPRGVLVAVTPGQVGDLRIDGLHVVVGKRAGAAVASLLSL